MIAVNTASNCETSCRLAPVTMSDNGTPCSSTSRWRLLPFFSPISRVGADCFLRQRRLHHRPINALPSPGNSMKVIVFGKPRLPQVLEESRLLPLQEARVNGACAAEVLGQRLPLTARSQHVHDALEHQPCILGLAPAPSLPDIDLFCRALPNRHKWLDPFPEFIRNFPRLRSCHLPLPTRTLRMGGHYSLFTDKF